MSTSSESTVQGDSRNPNVVRRQTYGEEENPGASDLRDQREDHASLDTAPRVMTAFTPTTSNDGSSSASLVASPTEVSPHPTINAAPPRAGSTSSSKPQNFSWSTTTLAILGLVAAVAFGIGSWVGQNKGNEIAFTSLLMEKYSFCADNEEFSHTPQCEEIIAELLRTLMIHGEHLDHPTVNKRSDAMYELEDQDSIADKYLARASAWLPDQLHFCNRIISSVVMLSGSTTALEDLGNRTAYIERGFNQALSTIRSFGTPSTRLKSLAELVSRAHALYDPVMFQAKLYMQTIEPIDDDDERGTKLKWHFDSLGGRLTSLNEQRPHILYSSATGRGMDTTRALFLEPPSALSLWHYLQISAHSIWSSTGHHIFVWMFSIIGFAALHGAFLGPSFSLSFSPHSLMLDVLMMNETLLQAYLANPAVVGATLVFVSTMVGIVTGFCRPYIMGDRSSWHMDMFAVQTVLTLLWHIFNAAALRQVPSGAALPITYFSYRMGIGGADSAPAAVTGKDIVAVGRPSLARKLALRHEMMFWVTALSLVYSTYVIYRVAEVKLVAVDWDLMYAR